ncbi:hypothetical protein BD769DRAFT_1490569 [Suillus cothurnatus]|nr:hypothetical protein BD769DRAFT_1490569 [Suillus cothurnatus]
MTSLSTRLRAASGSLLPSLLIPASSSRLDCPSQHPSLRLLCPNGKVTRMTGLANMVMVYHHANLLSVLVVDIVGATDRSLTADFLITGMSSRCCPNVSPSGVCARTCRVYVTLCTKMFG